MKRLIAAILALTLAFSLCACGEAPPPDPKELYTAAEEMLNNATALDYSFVADAAVKVEAQGLTMDMEMSGDCKYTGRGTDALLCSATTGVKFYGMDVETKLFYSDGYFYQSSDLGNYKTPIAADGFFEYLIEELGLSSDGGYLSDFTLTENEDGGYTVDFVGSGEAMGEMMEELSGGMGVEMNPEDVTVTGSMLLTAEGVPLSESVHMEFATDVEGMTMALTIDMDMSIHSLNGEDIVPEAPDMGLEYIEVNNYKLPEYFSGAYTNLASEQALALENSINMTFTAEGETDVYEDKYTCAYIQGETLSFDITDTASFGGVSSTSVEHYENGTITGVYDGEELVQSGFDDADMLGFITQMYSIFSCGWDMAENFSMEESAGVVTIEFDYKDEFVTTVIDNHYAMLTGIEQLSTYALSVDVDKAHAVMTFDADTANLLSHSVDSAAVYELDGLSMDVTIDFAQTITARGEDVKLGG